MSWNDELEDLIPLARSIVQGNMDEYRELVEQLGQKIRDRAEALKTGGHIEVTYDHITWLKYSESLQGLLRERGYDFSMNRVLLVDVTLFIYVRRV